MFEVVIIGCGAIAGGYDQADPGSPDVLTHAKAYTRHPGFRLAACVEPDRIKRQDFQRRWNIPLGFDSLQEVTIPFDVASVCVPTVLHTAVLGELLSRQPRLVFAEKPITDDLAQARSLVQAYDRAKISLCVNHLRRWAVGIAALRAEIAAGVWGDLQSGVGLYTKGLLNNGSHLIDLAGFLLGPLQPVARLRDVDEDRVFDPASQVIVATEQGVHLHLNGADGRNFTVFELDLLFSGGRIALTESSFCVVRRTVEPSAQFPGYQMLGPAQSQPTGLGQAMPGAVENIFAHLTEGQALASTGATALAAHDLCAALAAMPPLFPRRT